MPKARYSGQPFPETVFATMEPGGITGDPPYASYDESPLTEIAQVDYSKWIAKYRLVSVRKLRRKVQTTVRDVR